MPNRLANAVSPYLRSHAENPVDWFEWGDEAFAAAAERDVPVLVSIGYSTCHWCHVMARESFSDPELAAHLNANFVAIKVDREEYPDVDSTYLAAAGAFTQHLGWPLNVFVTPRGRAFYAGTYWPPEPRQGHPAFRQVLDAVGEAWRDRRDEVESNAGTVHDALAAQDQRQAGDGSGTALPDAEAWGAVMTELIGYEDTRYGGFGDAPKFPVAPVLGFLLDRGSLGDLDATALAVRTLGRMAASPLRDSVEGGFFRYSTMRDWSDPHYERMLYDNAMLLGAYSRVPGGDDIADGIAGFLTGVLRVGGAGEGSGAGGGGVLGGAFASAQDSESDVDGVRVEGVYYSLDAAARAQQHPPAIDAKVLTGWNGLAIEALADAGARHQRPDWIQAARDAADYLLAVHVTGDGTLVRASIDGRVSAARATLEDYGMFASALLHLALATGEVGYAESARRLVDAALSDAPTGFTVPGGADPTLAAHGVALAVDPSEGAYPSGITAMSGAAHTLFLLTADDRYRRAAESAMAVLAPLAVPRPISFGAALGLVTRLQAPASQLVVVTGDGDAGGSGDQADTAVDAAALVTLARGWLRAGSVTAVVTPQQARAFAGAGFELFEGRVPQGSATTAYLCRDFVCRLPLTSADALGDALADA
ncbi:thioredoxin domain-containing protein [Marisediminicola senii]|uniref:thioredoxin domain-containing protein n=1 Tax=Marisediminicola senii TaxID=2711233 RepID=UPI0013EDEDF1|nr:DUF255 domain-containing protein [Marisediminicola senii]